MKRYVVGFAYCPAVSRVVLIRREKDDWQKDKLNGLGGLAEPNEPTEEAMVREFYEEAGIRVPLERWSRIVSLMVRNDCRVDFFWAEISYEELKEINTRCPEGELCAVPLLSLMTLNLVPNTLWVIAMAFDADLIKPVHARSN